MGHRAQATYPSHSDDVIHLTSCLSSDATAHFAKAPNTSHLEVGSFPICFLHRQPSFSVLLEVLLFLDDGRNSSTRDNKKVTFL